MTVQLMQNVSVDPSKGVQVPVHAMKSSKQGNAKPKAKYSGDKATTKQGKCK